MYLGSSGAVAVTHATIARNRASSSNPFNGGGVASEDEVEEEPAVNTVLAENLPTNCGQWGLDSAGHNLADDASCGLGGPGDLEGVDAQLGPLGDFGGPTRSILPLPGSPAVEGGTDAGILVDQRGVTWPQLAQFDMGAVERRARRERESFPGGSVARPHRRDLDRGGRVDFADLDRLAAPLAAGAPPASTGAGNREPCGRSHVLPPTMASDHRANRLLAALDPADYRELVPHLRVEQLPRGAILQHPDEEVAGVWFPHDCVVSLTAVLRDGEVVETATIGREGAAGLIAALGDRRAVSRAIVQAPGAASWIDRPRFRAMFETRPGVRKLCLCYYEAFTGQLLQSVACNARHALDARLCRWLLMLQDRAGGEALHLTHEFLAEMLAVRRSTLTPTARKLQSVGLIRYRRGCVEILDRPGLEQASCECYASTRSHFEQVLAGSFG
ncbi:MAG TPA: Crp/Fnr family transcriptional regulator [Geminicoccaceae bacterium]|nr:Crp/Fnr family transcriptional regulator [Geminicoccaceae bacterium]